jgi:hypothetical protein
MRGTFAVIIYHGIQYLSLVWWLERQQRESPPALHAIWQKVPTLVLFLSFWLAVFAGSSIISTKVFPLFNLFWLRWAAVLAGAQSAHHYTADMFMWGTKAGK